MFVGLILTNECLLVNIYFELFYLEIKPKASYSHKQSNSCWINNKLRLSNYQVFV